MPTRAPVRCPSCKRLHSGTGRCPSCRKIAETARYAQRGTTTQRGLGWTHQRAVAELLTDNPPCHWCGAPATTGDHANPRSRGGVALSVEDYVPACASCNYSRGNSNAPRGHRLRRTSTTRRVTLIAGPPCSGKTTYARTHAAPDDTVADLDIIAMQLGSPRQWHHEDETRHEAEGFMRARMAAIARMATGTAWVIRCVPESQRRTSLAHAIGATRVLVLLPPTPTLVARARQRPQRAHTLRAIHAWLERYRSCQLDELIDTFDLGEDRR